jgi:hypothetical protein
MEDDGAVGEAVSSTAYKMVPTVGAVGAAATSPAFKMMMAVGGGGAPLKRQGRHGSLAPER